VRGGETLARLSGDEFAWLLPRAATLEAAVAVAERILSAVEEPFRVGEHELTAGVSIGIVVPDPTENPAAVMREADVAMYRAKEEGRGRFAVFDDLLYQRSLARLHLESELRQALDRHELVVYYQPVIDLGTDRLVGAEALVRWLHPSRGLVEPGSFISLAEETGLIVPLGQWVYAQAVAQLQEWDQTEGMPRLGIAVNLSARQLRDPALSSARRHLLDELGISHDRMCVEITETVAMDDDPGTRRTLMAMHANGVQIAIDDFGTGYSSLAYLQTLPVQLLKIDRRFVAGLGVHGESDAIVAAIVEMAHRLGLLVVAEGIERADQRTRLGELGADFGQGFLWTKALPAAGFADWCRRRATTVDFKAGRQAS
jgi:EAL domain-containing protein (putative c-di-GMP-specific phosphodiesterase class I)